MQGVQVKVEVKVEKVKMHVNAIVFLFLVVNLRGPPYVFAEFADAVLIPISTWMNPFRNTLVFKVY